MTGKKLLEARKKGGLTQEDAMKNIKRVIGNTNENNMEQIDWRKVWGQKYPILKRYTKEVDGLYYRMKLRFLLDQLKSDYQYNELEAMLVLKDILYQEWKKSK